MEEAAEYAKEKVVHTINSLDNRVRVIRESVDNQLAEMTDEEIRELARESLIKIKSDEFSVLKERVMKFRLSKFEEADE